MLNIESSAQPGPRREGRCPKPGPFSGGPPFGGRRGRGPRCEEDGECRFDNDCVIATQKCCGKYTLIVSINRPQQKVNLN